MYFFRDSAGNEIDLVLEKDAASIAIEIKAATKTSMAMLSNLRYWQKNNPSSPVGILLYDGNETRLVDDNTSILSWRKINEV